MPGGGGGGEEGGGEEEEEEVAEMAEDVGAGEEGEKHQQEIALIRLNRSQQRREGRAPKPQTF